MNKLNLKTKTYLWIASCIFAFIFALKILIIWQSSYSDYQPNPHQLIDKQQSDQYLAQFLDNKQDVKIRQIPTGLFIQSFRFDSSYDVHMTGYVWQRYTLGLHDDISRGVIFPEALDAGNSAFRLAYQKIEGDTEIIGWYFELVLRQNFDYRNYPFDHKTVWTRLWPKDFLKPIILTPDFDSYANTELHAIFGVDKEIVLAGWDIKETFFDFKKIPYDSDFGLRQLQENAFPPELNYNIVISRLFINPLIVSLIPLFTVYFVLFVMLLMQSSDEKVSKKYGFSIYWIISIVATLFFAVILLHINLRRTLASPDIVYIEYFYILSYIIFVVILSNICLFYQNPRKNLRFIHFQQNLLFKVLFWPFITGFLLVVSHIYL